MMQQVHGLTTTGATYGTQSRCSLYFKILTPQYFAYCKTITVQFIFQNINTTVFRIL